MCINRFISRISLTPQWGSLSLVPEYCAPPWARSVGRGAALGSALRPAGTQLMLSGLGPPAHHVSPLSLLLVLVALGEGAVPRMAPKALQRRGPALSPVAWGLQHPLPHQQDHTLDLHGTSELPQAPSSSPCPWFKPLSPPAGLSQSFLTSPY